MTDFVNFINDGAVVCQVKNEIGLRGYDLEPAAIQIPPFKAMIPYHVQLADSQININWMTANTTFDFSGNVPFVNPTTGISDITTFNVWDSATSTAINVRGFEITNNGFTGRIFKQNGYTSIGYVAGDGIVAGKCRTQINTYEIASRKKWRIEMVFKLADQNINSPFPMQPRNTSPMGLWQIKAQGLPPALVMAVDTHQNDPTKLLLNFDKRLSSTATGGTRICDVMISPNVDVSVKVDVFLDERVNGQGYLKITVNDNVIFEANQQTVQDYTTYAYAMSFSAYLYANATPLPYNKFVHFKTAKLLEI